MSYESELREVVLSLDVERMRELDERWFSSVTPMDDSVMLSVMHKIRLHLNGIPESARGVSRDWLAEHGDVPSISLNDRRPTPPTDCGQSAGPVQRVGTLVAPVGPPHR